MKKGSFIHEKLKIEIIDEIIPPKTFNYDGKKMTYLGESNKQDLVRLIKDSDKKVIQIIYTDSFGVLYEVCAEVDVGKMTIRSIRTRSK